MNPVMNNTSAGRKTDRLLLMGYFLVLALYYAGAMWPHLRVWGFNWWAYFNDICQYGLLAVGVILGGVIFVFARQLSPDDRIREQSTRYTVLFALSVVGLLTAFVVFRSTTHFLGDGYQLLSRLANQEHAVKSWDRGASLIQSAIYSLCSGTPRVRALMTFQIWSIVSGAGFLASAILLSRSLFENNRDRFLLFLGLALGGYSLMFFGYVENYATLIMAILIYTLLGLKVAQGKSSILWLIPPLLLAVFVHLFGLLLVPSFVYLALRRTTFGRRLARLSTKSKLLIAFIILLVAAIVYYQLYSRSYFFKFMLLPPVRDRFTVEDDMLFSLKHVIDVGNLLLLMLPGVVIYLLMLVFTPSLRVILREPPYRFIMISLVCSFLAVYVINPGIGMPRNWDLFSVIGVPLVALCYYSAIKLASKGSTSYMAIWLMIVLSFLSLAPRAAINASDDLAIAHFKCYLELDRVRNRNARNLLIDYYEARGDKILADQESARMSAILPEVAFCWQAKAYIDSGQFARAMKPASQAVALNPLYWDAYANLGVCCRRLGMLDSALTVLEIADGLNPYNARITYELGAVAMLRHKNDKAEKLFLQSLELDSTLSDPMFGLASIYIRTNRVPESFEYLSMQYRHGFQDSTYFRRAGDTYVHRGFFNFASTAYSFALDRGLDSAYVTAIKQRFPQMR